MTTIRILKNIKKKSGLFVIAILTLYLLSINLNLFFIEESLLNKDPLAKDVTDKLNLSGTYSDIFIDDSPGSPINWAWAKEQPWVGGGSGNSSDPYIIEDHTFNYSGLVGPSFIISNSRKHFIIRNCTFRDSKPDAPALYMSNTTNGVISQNKFYNNGAGILFHNSSEIKVNGNTVYDNYFYGIDISSNSHKNNISMNNVYNNSNYGIQLIDSDFNDLLGNEVYNHINYSISLETSHHNTLTGNTVYDCKKDGILCDTSNDNTFEQNSINNNKRNGILLLDSQYTSLENNTIFDNNGTGIILDGSLFNTISDNLIFDNLLNGINITRDLGASYSDSNNITMNSIYHNNASGIIIEPTCDYNDIWENYIYDNIMHGIYLQNSDNGKYYGNWIYDNNKTGIYCTTGSQDNNFYENVFVRNEKHAVDEGSSNYWNNTIIGNYWDNHTEPDTSPPDGIVDIQYNVSGSANSIDFLPIAEDGAPRITILSPDDGNSFNEIAPNFALTIIEDYLVSRWYTINDSATIYPFTGLSGTIDQTAWNTLSEGNLILTFYAYDLVGKKGTKEIIIQKDTIAPMISIFSPTSGDLFSTTPPSFNITATDPNLDTIWYILDGNITIIDNILNWSINKTVWSALPDGNITIKFYANDLSGNIGSEEVILQKDTLAPVIIVNSPNSGDEFGNTSPLFNISVIDPNLDTKWYTLDGTNIILGSILIWNISKSVWDALPKGNVTITIYANDTLGHISSEEITIVKNISSGGNGSDSFMIWFLIILIGSVSIGVSIIVVIMKKRSKTDIE